MVCESPRMRPLCVTRRGQFFEDPFFRDAWSDYNHAVRRIVDRFNHGWVSHTNRIRDSQYHSMYRTLRTARLNYSAHSARFKEEGNKYKLVMDVHEFIGGDITVRTAGSTVSVRGKVEAGADCANETTLTTKDGKDDDASSVSSGMSTSCRTLHRRFTLPADADCENVESSLSKDAVLTVTIPKRTDVHYIPVTIEGDRQINTERNEYNMNRLGGIKRPSDSKTESNRKKPQEESARLINNDEFRHNWKRRSDDSRQNEDAEDSSEGCARRSRYDVFYGDNKPELHQRTTNGTDPRKRTYEESKGTTNTRKNSGECRSRKRENKYEELHEINIPIKIHQRDHSDRVYRPRSLTTEPNFHHIEIQTQRPKSFVEPSLCDAVKDDERLEKRIRKSSSSSHENESPKLSRKISPKEIESRIGTPGLAKQEFTSRNGNPIREKGISLDRITNPEAYRRSKYNLGDLDDCLKGVNATSCNKENRVPILNQRERQELESKSLNQRYLNDHGKSQYKPLDLNTIYTVSDEKQGEKLRNNASKVSEFSLPNKTELPSVGLGTKLDLSVPKSDAFGSKLHSSSDVPPKAKDGELPDQIGSNMKKNDDATSESKANKCQHKPANGLTIDTLSVQIPNLDSSPPSPGGREVKVERGQGCMEDDIFRDCWSDFSNTLQEVLNRLQELSSELGQSKLLATTPCSEEANKDLSKKNVPLTSNNQPYPEERNANLSNANQGAKNNLLSEKDEKTRQYPFTENAECSDSEKTSTTSSNGIGLSKEPLNNCSMRSFNPPPNEVISSPAERRYASNDALSNGLKDAHLLKLDSSSTTHTPGEDSPVADPISTGGKFLPLHVGGDTVSLDQESQLYMPNEDHKSKGRHVKLDESSSTYSGEGGSKSHPTLSPTVGQKENSFLNDGLFGSQIPRPTSLFLSKDPEGSLLAGLRKNSPVEALQEKFLRKNSPSCNTLPSDVHYLSVEFEDNASVPANIAQGSDPARSNVKEKISPTAAQSSTVSGTKKTSSESVSDAQPNSDLSEQNSPNKGANVKVEFPSDSEEESERNSECESPVTVSISEKDFINIIDDISGKQQVRESIFHLSENGNHKNASEADQSKSEIANPLNNLNNSNVKLESPTKTLYPNRESSFQPNIGSLESPESNLTDENELNSPLSGEGIVEGKLSIPFNSFLHQLPNSVINAHPHINKDTKTVPPSTFSLPHVGQSDVTACNSDVDDLKIPSDDVMGGEHLPQTRVGRPRVDTGSPLSPAKAESSRFILPKKQCQSSYSHQQRGDAEHFRPLRREMGGVFSRSKPGDLPKPAESPPVSPSLKSPPGGGTQHYPFRTAARSRERSSTEVPLPSYVRQRSEPSRRFSGFAHVTSDNVKRMRDVWGDTRQDKRPDSQPPSCPQSPLSKYSPTQVPPPSPTRTTSRRISDLTSESQQWRKSSPISPSYSGVKPISPTEKTKNAFGKRSPSPTPLSGRVSSDSPSRSRNSPSRNSPNRTPLQDYQRRASPSPYRSQNPSLGQRTEKGRSPSPRRTRNGINSHTEKRNSPPSGASPSRRRNAEEFKENVSCPSPSSRRRNKEPGRGVTDRSARPDSMPTMLDQQTTSAKYRPKEPSVSRAKSSAEHLSSKAHQRIFKRLRNASLQPDSEAICFKEEQDKYTMVLDVEEYVPGEIEVLQDDKVLTVKGRVEAKESGNHVSVRTFSRTFNIPRNTREEKIDSALSEDGILTIFVPKKKERIIKIELVD